ncbi:MAG: thioredoxin [Anaerolineae bacterium]|nr:thioredoxin [Anaerolineae bacterium]
MAADLLALATTSGAIPEDAAEDETNGAAGNGALANGQPVHVTDATFEQLVLKSDVPVLVDFWADWCQPCKMVAPILEKLAKEFAGQIRVAKVDVDANPALAQGFRIMSIPTLMFVKNGKIVGQSAGAAPEPALRDAIKQLIALQV